MKNLLTSNNLVLEKNDGIALATVCATALQSEFFAHALRINTAKRFGLHSSDSLVARLTKEIQTGLIGNCECSAVIESLHKGIIAGTSFRTHWIIGNKSMKKTIREAAEKSRGMNSDFNLNEIICGLKNDVHFAFQESLVHTAPIRHANELLAFIARNCMQLNMIGTLYGKLRLLKKYSVHPGVVSNLHRILPIINSMQNPHLYEKSRTERNIVGNRLRNSLLRFSLEKLAQGAGLQIILATCDFFRRLLNHDIVLYFHSGYDNDAVIIDAVFAAMNRGSVKVHVLTCPDYSGFIDKDGLWNFDFKNLNSGEGIVARKSYGLTEAIYRSFEACGIKTSVYHDLPFFEFKDGFRGDGYLSDDAVRMQLKGSLDCIREHYNSQNISACTRSTEEVISNESFFERADAMAREVLPRLLGDNKRFQSFFDETFRKRFGIYSAWFPKGDMSDEEYIVFLRQKLLNQLAEYYTDAKLYHDDESILVFADSAQMSYAYSFWDNIPAICGHGKNAIQYVG